MRHSSASLVPGFTPVHCVMKSERQEARIAEICSDVGCCAGSSGAVTVTLSDRVAWLVSMCSKANRSAYMPRESIAWMVN